jgi:hypothetical protein
VDNLPPAMTSDGRTFPQEKSFMPIGLHSRHFDKH